MKISVQGRQGKRFTHAVVKVDIKGCSSPKGVLGTTQGCPPNSPLKEMQDVLYSTLIQAGEWEVKEG